MLLYSEKPELVLSFFCILACIYVLTSDKCKATGQMHLTTKISSVGSFFFNTYTIGILKCIRNIDGFQRQDVLIKKF